MSSTLGLSLESLKLLLQALAGEGGQALLARLVAKPDLSIDDVHKAVAELKRPDPPKEN